jgi:hypothetical protein
MILFLPFLYLSLFLSLEPKFGVAAASEGEESTLGGAGDFGRETMFKLASILSLKLIMILYNIYCFFI